MLDCFADDEVVYFRRSGQGIEACDLVLNCLPLEAIAV
jgi:hypothetical protein